MSITYPFKVDIGKTTFRSNFCRKILISSFLRCSVGGSYLQFLGWAFSSSIFVGVFPLQFHAYHIFVLLDWFWNLEKWIAILRLMSSGKLPNVTIVYFFHFQLAPGRFSNVEQVVFSHYYFWIFYKLLQLLIQDGRYIRTPYEHWYQRFWTYWTSRLESRYCKRR